MFENFEWDAAKAKSNLKKHRVSFEEATTVFLDPRSITTYDPDHSKLEDRFVTIGISGRTRVLTIVHADRENRIRIITARRATRLERQAYEENE